MVVFALHFVALFSITNCQLHILFTRPSQNCTESFLWFPAYFLGILWIYVGKYSSGVNKDFQIVNPLLDLMELLYLSYHGALMFGFCIFIIIIHIRTEMKKHISNLEVYSSAFVTIFIVIAINILAEIGGGLASQGAGS